MKSFYIKLSSIILILCLGIVVYSNTFHCSFHFDDGTFITDNSFIKDIHHLLNIWKFYPARFVIFLTVALNYHYNGTDVFGYHLVNLLIHLFSAVLAWWLTLLTLSTPVMNERAINKSNRNLPVSKLPLKDAISGHAHLIALFVGLVFVSHPVQTEAVTYIWQRAASLVALFYMLSLCCYVKFRLLQDQKTKSVPTMFFYICSLLTAIVAMFTKENAITLPLAILLYEFSFFRTNKNFNWGYAVPFLFTILIIPLTITFTKSEMSQSIHGVVEGSKGISPVEYLLTQFRVIVTYIRLVFVPIHQNLDYDFPVYKSLFELPVLSSFLFLLSILYLAIRLFSKYRLLSFSIFWFFLTLLPESSFLPLEDVAFEHRLYLPLVGYSLFLVSGIYYLFGKNIIKAMVAVLIMIVACNSLLTYQRNKVWKNDLTLWEDTVQKSPHKARAYGNRGKEYYAEGDFSKAMADFNKAIEINPKYAEALYNRGLIYYKYNNFSEAVSNYDRAIEINPGFALTYNNCGSAYNKLGNFAQAVADFNKAIELNPDFSEAYNNRGNAYDKEGLFDQAIADFNKAIELNPDFAEGYINRGNTYNKQGDFDKAIADFNKAIGLNPKIAEAYISRGNTYDKQGNFVQAIADFNQTIDLDSDYAEAYINLGVVYDQEGNLSQSIAAYNKAIEINPKYAEAYNMRGNDYAQQGNFALALVDHNKAIELNPRYAEAYNMRGNDYAQQGNLTKALFDYSKAIEINPKSAETYSNRGFTYNNQGNYVQAISDSNKAIEINPRYAQAYINRGNAYAKQNNLPQAVSDYTKAIEINPRYVLAYSNRAILYYQMKAYGNAWGDVNKIKGLGGAVNSDLIKLLNQVSGVGQ